MARILLVDDDERVRSALADVLANFGHEVTQAANGRDALRALDRSVADAVILDLLMPEMDGIEVLRELRRRWPGLPVLVISGGGHRGWLNALEVAQALGANRVLSKPFTSEQLLEEVGALLSRGNSC